MYNFNDKETKAEGAQSVIDHFVKNKSFLNTTVHTWEMYPIESYQQKRARREKQMLESMPKKGPETTLLKMLLYEALGDKAATVRMTPKEKQAIKDYVHEKL